MRAKRQKFGVDSADIEAAWPDERSGTLAAAKRMQETPAGRRGLLAVIGLSSCCLLILESPASSTYSTGLTGHRATDSLVAVRRSDTAGSGLCFARPADRIHGRQCGACTHAVLRADALPVRSGRTRHLAGCSGRDGIARTPGSAGLSAWPSWQPHHRDAGGAAALRASEHTPSPRNWPMCLRRWTPATQCWCCTITACLSGHAGITPW